MTLYAVSIKKKQTNKIVGMYNYCVTDDYVTGDEL